MLRPREMRFEYHYFILVGLLMRVKSQIRWYNLVTRRRSLLQKLGISATGAGLLTGAVVETSDEETPLPKNKYPELYEFAVREYGEFEAEIGVDIVDHNLQQKERHEWDRHTTNQKIGDAIIDHPDTPNSSEDIRNYREAQTKTRQSPPIPPAERGRELELEYENSHKHWSYLCSVDVDTDTGDDIIRAFSDSTIYGSGFAWGRLYGRYTPSESETIEITCQYEIWSHVQNATCDVSLYVREDGQGPIFESVDEMNAGIDETRTRTAQFDLDADEGYNVGVELHTESSAAGMSSVSDVHSNTMSGRRHFRVCDFSIE